MSWYKEGDGSVAQGRRGVVEPGDWTLYRAFDLFCGGGGSSCGARMAGVELAGGVDAWEVAAEAYRQNFPGGLVYQSRIERLTATRVAREVGQVDFLLASPECTNHSVAKGASPRCEVSRRTAFEVIRFARAMQPRWVVVENVTAMRNWHSYGEWLAGLERLGYRTLETTLDASDFGVAQSRRRLFVICDREDDPQPPTKRRGPKPSVRSVLGSMNGQAAEWEFTPLKSPGRAKPTLQRARRAIKEVGEEASFLLVYYGTDAAGGWQSLDRPLRTITTLDRFALVERNGSGHVMRMLQPPELAAAMGFPKDYRWPETTRRNRIKLIGNAVSPPVMKAVVSRLLESS